MSNFFNNLNGIIKNYNSICDSWVLNNDISYEYEKGYKTPCLLMSKSEFLEYKTFNEIKFIDGFKKVLVDLLINLDDKKSSQIDLVALHKSGIYVIECKNISSIINGNYSDEYWSYSNNSIYSPLYQNNSHIEALKNKLNIYDDFYFNSIVVFGNKSNLNICNDSSDKQFYNPYIINQKDIKSTLYKISNEKKDLFSDDDLIRIYKKLSTYSRPTPESKLKHLEYVKKIRK